MGAKYIYRMDDVTPDMNWDKFLIYLKLFNKHGVKPLIGVVPENKDNKLSINKPKIEFWEFLRDGKRRQFFDIAQHGYQHLYVTTNEGLLTKKFGFKNQSEFAGLDYLTQYVKISKGKEIMIKNGVETDIFMAPSHSFDNLTIRALQRLGFKYITDGIGLFPFTYDKLKFLPQQCWAPRKFHLGIITICLHTNTIKDDMYERIEKHLKSNDEIISFSNATKINNKMWYTMINYFYKNYMGIKSNIRKLKNS